MLEAMANFDKALKKGKFFGISFSQEELKKFDIEKEKSNSYTNSYLGVKEVSLDKIVGSVQKTEDFKKGFIPKNEVVKFRWCNIYIEMIGDKGLPPVSLYKIKDEYYVYDGNHRVSVASYLNFNSIEAEVTEYFSSNESTEKTNYQDKFSFEKKTGLEIEITNFRNYKILLDDIEKYERLVKEEDEYKEKKYSEIAKEWYLKIFQPIIKILEFNPIWEPKKTIGDIFVRFLKHKNRLIKTKNNHANDYSYGVLDYMNLIWLKSDYTIKNQIKLNEYTLHLLEELHKFDIEINLPLKERCQLQKIRKLIPGHFMDEIYFAHEVKIEIFDWIKKEIDYYLKIFIDKSKKDEKVKIIVEDKLRMYRQLRNYYRFYKREHLEATKRESILDYIIEVSLPTISYLEKKFTNIEDFQREYFKLTRRKRKFLESGRDMELEELENIYFDFRNKSSYFKDWIINNPKKEYSIFKGIKEILITKAQDVEAFEEIMELYGGTTNYETIVKLKEILLDELDRDPTQDWVKSSCLVDIDNLMLIKDAVRFFKTKKILHKVKKKINEYTFIDLYVCIIDFRKSENLEDLTLDKVVDKFIGRDIKLNGFYKGKGIK